ncbi:MAG TPA: hypothetical protein EYP17_00195, partial [Candidatus Latescibacteria bacterium]|nr:hypothetical protein [Candidatus Latescibacterota bacterium]
MENLEGRLESIRESWEGEEKYLERFVQEVRFAERLMDAKETIDRIVGIFPSYEQNRIRMTLASVLQSVISQRLIKKINGGRKAVTELLFTTQRIKQL